MTTDAITGIGLVILAALIIWSEKRKYWTKLEEAFSGRESLTPLQSYEAEFRSKNIPFDIVAGVREILEYHIGTDLSRMRASDSLAENLSFVWSHADDLADAYIVRSIEDHFDIKISKDEIERLATFEDFVQLVHRKRTNQ